MTALEDGVFLRSTVSKVCVGRVSILCTSLDNYQIAPAVTHGPALMLMQFAVIVEPLHQALHL